MEVTVTVPAERRLAVHVTGKPDGTPVFLLHGTPGGRSGPKPRDIVLYRMGVRLICYDRPGYGGSTPHRGRRVADAASDVAAIADHLRLERFAVVGRSGGGPHALACAALLPGRVIRTAVLVSLAPADADGLDWYDGMTADNADQYSAVGTADETLTERLRLRAMRTQEDPESLLQALHAELSWADRRVVDDVALRRLLLHQYADAVRQGPEGWVDDALALRNAWGFDLAGIRCPVRLWHGAKDRFAPASHTRWLAGRIPAAEVVVEPDLAHFGAIEVLPQVISWLTTEEKATLARSAPARATAADPARGLEGVRVE